MQTCDTLLHAGVLLTQDDDRRVLENAALAIDGGRIVALGYSQDVTAAWQAREILDLSGMLVMPGLVNAHTHAAMTFLRGLADDMPLMDWLQQKIFPVEQGLKPDLVRLGSLLGFAEMLRTGTTSCVDMYIFESAVLEAADKAGLRCLAGEGVFNFPSACCPDADAALACTREMAQRWAGHDRLHVAVMPHSVYTTTAAQLTACRELADELGLPLHIHLAETRQETALSQVPPCKGTPPGRLFRCRKGPAPAPAGKAATGRAPAQATCSDRPRRRRTKRRISRTSAHRAG